MSQTRRRLLELSAAAVAAPAFASANNASSTKSLRILILGGTGFIGPSEVRYALARGHTVTIFNRGRQQVSWPGPVEELLGDRSTGNLKSLEGREWDVCIDNPATLPFWVRDAAAVLKERIKHYIFVSTVSVYATNDVPNADETAAVATYKGQDAMAERKVEDETYGPLKALSEREAQRQFGKAVTIVRPGLIMGPGDQSDRFTYWPVRLARGGDVLVPGDGSDHVQMIGARDLAEWIVRLGEQHSYGVFNATGPQRPLTMRGFIERVDLGVEAKPNLVWVSTAFLEAHKVSAWSDMPVWVPEQGETVGFSRRNIARALKVGLTFRPLSVTAADTLGWFRQQPADRQTKVRAGLSKDHEAELLTAWRAATPAHL